MTRYTLIIAVLVILVLGSTLSCASTYRNDRLDKLQVQVEALNNSLYANQQELVSTRRALIEAQEKANLLEMQLQVTQKNVYTSSACPVCPEPTVVVVYEPVRWPLYYPYPPLPPRPYPPPPPHPYPPPPPPHPLPPTPPIPPPHPPTPPIPPPPAPPLISNAPIRLDYR